MKVLFTEDEICLGKTISQTQTQSLLCEALRKMISGSIGGRKGEEEEEEEEEEVEEYKKDISPTICQQQATTLIPFRKLHLMVPLCAISLHSSYIFNTVLLTVNIKLLYFFPVALRPNEGHGLLILEVSRSHTATHHSR